MQTKTKTLIVLIVLSLVDMIIPIPILGMILLAVVIQRPPWFRDVAKRSMIRDGQGGGVIKILPITIRGLKEGLHRPWQRKKIIIIVSFLILLGLAGVYFLFPGTVFNLLVKAERSAGGLKQHRIDVQGRHFAYLEGGTGDVVVLLHGFGANKDNWTRMARYLTPHFRVIAPDLTGFGESSPDPGDDYSINVQARRVNDFVRALGIHVISSWRKLYGREHCRRLCIPVSEGPQKPPADFPWRSGRLRTQ